jgi:hypothetical protein
MSLGLRLLVEDDLDNTGAVAHVKEQQISEIAAPRHPAENDGGFASVGPAEGSAVMGALQTTEKVQHDVIPFRRKSKEPA